MTGTWSSASDRVLATLFIIGKPAPTKAELQNAYPFGERAYWPYKVWLRRVVAWRKAHAKANAIGLTSLSVVGPAGHSTRDTATLDAFAEAQQ